MTDVRTTKTTTTAARTARDGERPPLESLADTRPWRPRLGVMPLLRFTLATLPRKGATR